ncbi:type 2 isopentenyl-diphosphate Delta-isomerase [Alkalicoccus daliensis]|uniref:Isopentenyl-diphosphate delta-isomerase n=1 Tax=Alkalicoccus daliensis TaxID=745820 RepID=A0A1H0AWE0_9BACI|nr:type 2 isopentenyl-diphosphate Delta-isomerase [Alkalicoccus daliensis]SDN37768.1 isopentenyl-diphosphate delta-isomerase [Alkalicoccus daliensis]
MSRTKRKLDHINHALSSKIVNTNGLEDITFVHQSFPETSLNSISIESEYNILKLGAPLFINAMTGGGGKATEGINAQLAEIANSLHIPIAVGSQMAALKDNSQRASYEIVRKNNPRGLVFANVGSEATIDEALACVEMLEADALQIHMNTIQELVMPEGDRDFKGALSHIGKIVEKLHIPVIVKEVGFGMSRETAEKLLENGVECLDTGGKGGTNFSLIENARREKQLPFFDEWGISTAASLVEVKAAGVPHIAASGGIKTSEDIAKAIALGGDMCGMAGQVLKWLQQSGQQAAHENLENVLSELKIIMTALGAKNISELQRVPLIISGDTYHWLQERGNSTKHFAGRTIK